MVIQLCLALSKGEWREKRGREVLESKVNDFPEAKTEKNPDNIKLHIKTSSMVDKPIRVALGKLLDLKSFTEKTLQESNIKNSNLITQIDNGKASLTVIKRNEH